MHSLMRIFGPYLFHTTNNKKIRIRYDFLRMNVRRTDHINITPDKMNKFSVIFKLSFINTIFFYLPILANNSPVDYVNTLVGTQSKFELSTGNTYPAIAMPWGMNFWTPQTGDMGDGWTYTYNADKRVQTDPPTQSLDERLRAIRPYAGNRRSRVRTKPTCQLVFPQSRDS